MTHCTYLISYEDFREHCENCKSLLSKVFIGNPHLVTVYCSAPKCPRMDFSDEEIENE